LKSRKLYNNILQNTIKKESDKKHKINRKNADTTQKERRRKVRKKAEMTCEEAAKVIHKSAQYVRLGLQQGTLPIGSAVQKTDGKWSYHIVTKRVYEYAGI